MKMNQFMGYSLKLLTWWSLCIEYFLLWSIFMKVQQSRILCEELVSAGCPSCCFDDMIQMVCQFFIPKIVSVKETEAKNKAA